MLTRKKKKKIYLDTKNLKLKKKFKKYLNLKKYLWIIILLVINKA